MKRKMTQSIPILFLLLLLNLPPLLAFSYDAEQTISGVVTDETGETLIGVNILLKNTAIGTVTGIDGSYRLAVPDDATTLVFSYTGYQSHCNYLWI